ncbi:PssD/Cps14F family polysaccharide biosynthesis glycosyltransferase [Pseudolactococcus paracarnosus]|uniref:Polysaccharide biosynthesis protein n=1 Tax=Pseudolactococcus paracarnosus TaxID=2749962 RepID=A0A7L4WFE6_9LACT|nr:PssD/Cps14F family polysaccharide biosynthesis glycosyltransferase [Lactococcus paracarnosus]QDJ28947.1 polysaccharide biosynthesis protein [Lactococcus paracarnosus]
MKYKDKIICFASSSGGHFEQLMMLKPLMKKYPRSFIVTEKTDYKIYSDINIEYMCQVNRKQIHFFIYLIINFIISFFIVLRKKPDIIICTGALSMIPMCLVSKLFGAKLIFIESFAKINSPTLTGKFLYKYADVFYVQWETMKKFYPEAIFLGGIY